jgi:ribosome-associated protein
LPCSRDADARIAVAALLQLAQVGQVRASSVAQLGVVQPARHFFAVARDEGHGGTAIQQLHRRIDLRRLGTDVLGNLRRNLQRNQVGITNRQRGISHSSASIEQGARSIQTRAPPVTPHTLRCRQHTDCATHSLQSAPLSIGDAPMLRITPSIAIPDTELVERFIRASGPGGQNVNKVATAVELRFDVAQSTSLPEALRERVLAKRDRRLTIDGVIVITAQRFRTQERNREDARERLATFILSVLKPPAPRIETRPTRASKERRLGSKRERAGLKRQRASHAWQND